MFLEIFSYIIIFALLLFGGEWIAQYIQVNKEDSSRTDNLVLRVQIEQSISSPYTYKIKCFQRFWGNAWFHDWKLSLADSLFICLISLHPLCYSLLKAIYFGKRMLVCFGMAAGYWAGKLSRWKGSSKKQSCMGGRTFWGAA